MTNINDVLDFWFAPDSRPDHRDPGGRDLERWFAPDPAFDDAIRKHFADALERAVRGELDGWAETAEGALALTVLLDQFPRNMFRGQARARAVMCEPT